MDSETIALIQRLACENRLWGAERIVGELLANSGSSESTSEAWVRALNPRLVLISVGAGNADGNPTIEVLGRLAGRDVMRTDEHGDIGVETDGKLLWVEVSR